MSSTTLVSEEEYLASSYRPDRELDPSLRRAYVCTRTGLQQPEDGILEVATSPIRIPLAELFACLDR